MDCTEFNRSSIPILRVIATGRLEVFPDIDIIIDPTHRGFVGPAAAEGPVRGEEIGTRQVAVPILWGSCAETSGLLQTGARPPFLHPL